MKAITNGYRYKVSNFDNTDEHQVIQFIQKDESGETISDGTTNEELLEVLIDRITFLNNKFPCRENSIVVTKLEESLMWLNKRTADRTKRNVIGKNIK